MGENGVARCAHGSAMVEGIQTRVMALWLWLVWSVLGVLWVQKVMGVL